MLRKLALGSALPILLLSFNVQAFPALSEPPQTAASDMTLVRGFCGLGRHRGPYGGCVRNGAVVAPPVIVAPRYAPPPVVVAPPPVVVAPRYAPVVGAQPVCPYGYYLDQYGRCLPY
jgi:hypothetical protein